MRRFTEPVPESPAPRIRHLSLLLSDWPRGERRRRRAVIGGKFAALGWTMEKVSRPRAGAGAGAGLRRAGPLDRPPARSGTRRPTRCGGLAPTAAAPSCWCCCCRSSQPPPSLPAPARAPAPARSSRSQGSPAARPGKLGCGPCFLVPLPPVVQEDHGFRI
ncbi:hypothetical protein P7K49_034401 [Saguinus oedipus]|uniref:Uncharacterized protein n=1 Tax=Saguinus oedipus TaxID=9490 RepID=A0ABQ9TV78_SAGOE|nr:hypothetical protein P7K49_034401 [Saguinus oedipus]